MNEKTFARYEQEGWQRNAIYYDEIDLPATKQSFAPLVGSIGALQGLHVLDIGSGTGHLAEQAVVHGAKVTGIDVATNIVELALQNVPKATFHVGDAEALPYEDESFDAVLCCFGLPHFAQPEQALREAARVLKSGGIYSFTIWQSPENGNDFFRFIHGTLKKYADMEVGLPPAPNAFALADPAICNPMLIEAGFENIHIQDVPIVWPISGPGTVFEQVIKGGVRSRMLYERQTPKVQQLIREALNNGTMQYVRDGKDGIPCPAVLITARKAS